MPLSNQISGTGTDRNQASGLLDNWILWRKDQACLNLRESWGWRTGLQVSVWATHQSIYRVNPTRSHQPPSHRFQVWQGGIQKKGGSTQSRLNLTNNHYKEPQTSYRSQAQSKIG